jgi:hypothetical protein
MALNPYDQSVYDAGYKYIPQSQYLLNPYAIPQGTENEVPSGLPAIYQAQNVGGGGGGALQVGDPMMNFDNFYNYTGNKYMMNQDRPNLDSYSDNAQKTFLGMPSYRQQELTGPDMGEYIGSNTNIPLEQTMAGNIQSKIGSFTGGIQDLMGKVPTITSLLNRIGVQNFDSLSPQDQLFIKTNSGYRGPTVFGENTSGLNVDPFGLNVESLMGNYAEAVRDDFDQLQSTLTKNRPGVTFNELTGEFEGEDKDLVAATNKQTNMIRNKFLFRKKQIDQQEKNRRDLEKKAAQDAEIAAAVSRRESARQYDPNVHGPTNYGLGSDGRQSYDSGQGFGTNATSGGPVSNRTGRGRTDYMDGGLADLVDIYD